MQVVRLHNTFFEQIQIKTYTDIHRKDHGR
jgi:hypothetical protein